MIISILWEMKQAGAATDLDIYLVDQFGNKLFGFNRNNLNGDPLEILPFVVQATVDAKIIITRKGGNQNVLFKYILFRGEGTITSNVQGTGTVIGQANDVNAIAVGAVLYSNTPAYGTTPPTIASFSSRGGTLVNGVNTNKPDIVAPNGVNTTVNFGGVNIDNDPFPNFFGTSAAAPHAAAVAALLIEAKKRYFDGESFTAPQMKTVLQNTAIDMGAAGYDDSTGHGFIQADDALQSFSNPFPQVIDMHLQDSAYTPGADPVTVVINGEYFANNASVIFQYDTIPADVTANGTQLTANIPAFLGNPPLTVFNPAITPNGLDGGVSDSLYFFTSIPKNVMITVNNATKRFGEMIPAYTVTVTVK